MRTPSNLSNRFADVLAIPSASEGEDGRPVTVDDRPQVGSKGASVMSGWGARPTGDPSRDFPQRSAEAILRWGGDPRILRQRSRPQR
jgi:hypothetical protein